MNSILKITLVALATLISTNNSQASALLVRDDATKTLKVIARMVYSGPALTETIADASTREINEMWNENPTNITINGSAYHVKFEIDYIITDKKLLNDADSCAYNYITVLNKTNAGDRSYYTGLGTQYGVFYTSDDLGHSTTTAHEFGHGLLLDHNDYDQRAANPPGIMFARGTLVKPEFQWNPNALPGQAGGTINPVHRKVRSQDIRDIPFEASGKVSQRTLSCLGNGAIKAIDL